jgi:phosphatidylglycerophosphate synthase
MKTVNSPLPTPPPKQGVAAQKNQAQHILARDAALHLAGMGLLVLVLAMWLASVADWGLRYAAHAIGAYGLGVWLVWRGLRHHPFAQFGAANLVTLGRMAVLSLLVALAAQALWYATPKLTPWAVWALVAVAVGTASLDAVDGALARRNGLASDFGARFDMETDAAFILVMCVLVAQHGHTGPWILAVGLMRYLFVAAAYIWPWLSAPLALSRRRQAVCVLQVIVLIACLAPVISPRLAFLLGVGSLAALALSFAIDVLILAQQRHTT